MQASVQRRLDIMPTELAFYRVVSGHGRVVDGGREALEAALREAGE